MAMTDETNLHARGGLLRFSDSLDNPNRMPFSGVLTYFGVPSDQPPGGSGGLKVMIPVDVGKAALPSLVGMPVNLAASMDDHDTSAVVGHIENAWLGDPDERGAYPAHVEGIVYAKSFPDEAREIKAQKERLGFSYETAKTSLTAGIHNGEKVAVAQSLVFTGAAILYKQSAAYQTTSLAAAAGDDTLRTVLEAISDLKDFTDKRVDRLQDYVDDRMDDVQTLVEKLVIDEKVEQASEENEMHAKGEPTLENIETKPTETLVAAQNDGIKELTAAVASLADMFKGLATTVSEIKTKQDEAAVTAAAQPAEPAPARTSLTGAQLSAKFDKEVAGTELVASIDAKNLDTTASMAAKLALLID